MFTMLSYFARICVFLIIIVLLENGESVHPWQFRNYVDVSPCNSKECFDHAKYLSGILNPNVDPCNDFYEYVCGLWAKKHPVSGYYPERSVDMMVAGKAYEELKAILEQSTHYYDTPGLKQAKKLYEACMNLPSLGLMDSGELRHYIQEARYFPLFMKKLEIDTERKVSWLTVHNYYLSVSSESAFFSVAIRADRSHDMKPILHISPQKSAFGLIWSLNVLTITKLRNYKEFLMSVLNYVKPVNTYKVSYTLVEKRLLDVLVFRRALSKIISDFSSSEDCSSMTMKTFDELHSYDTPMSWANIVYALYKNTDNPLSISEMKICITHRKYFTALIRLLDKTSHDVIVNNIHLYFIERHLHLTPHLKEMLLKAIIQNGRLEERIRYLGKRAYQCIKSNEMQEAIGKAYISRYFPESTKNEGEKLAKKLKDMMKIQISESVWLNDAAKQLAEQRIEDMKTVIGYPEYYNDPLLETEYKSPIERVKPVSTDVFYSGKTNRLSISAAFFHPPVYHPTFPLTIVYGSIGSSIAHEMYHAFSLAILNCKKITPCWPENMLYQHGNKAACFYKQFHNKSLIELRSIPNAPVTDGLRTLDENISDSMGLNLAYWTFRKEVWQKKKCPKLKNLRNISCEQLFFISYAASFCASTTVDKMMELVQEEEHGPERIRVNGAVSNLEEFSQAFRCSKNAPMNPSERCDLWK